MKCWGLQVRALGEGWHGGPIESLLPPITCLLSPSPANLHCLLHLAWAEQLISRIGWGMESQGKVGNRFPGPTGTAGIREEGTPLHCPVSCLQYEGSQGVLCGQPGWTLVPTALTVSLPGL